MFFKGHLDDDEELFFVAHKHWIEVITVFLKVLVFGFVIPLIAFYFLSLQWYWVIIWIVFFLCWGIYHCMDWYFDALLVTSASVIDVEWHSLFYRESSRVDYPDLKEIGYEINGFWATMLNYGNLHVHLNSGGQVDLTNVQNPKNVELMIQKYKQYFLQDQKMTDSATLQEILADIVKNYIQENGLPESPPDIESLDNDHDIGHRTF